MKNYDDTVLIFAGFYSHWLSSVRVLLWTSWFLLSIHAFCLLTSRDVSLLSHHPKHQLSTCITIRLFQGLSSHIFWIYVSLSGSFQTFLVFPNICYDTLSPWVILYGSKFIYIPTLWFYNPDCDGSELFYKFWYVLYKEWHQI